MKLLCVDIGNTRAHYAVIENGEIQFRGNLNTKCLADPRIGFRSALKHISQSGESMNAIAFCSVVPSAESAFRREIAATGWRQPLFHLSHRNCPGLQIQYPLPEEVGQDRLANSIAAQEITSLPAIVIDMGTAVTFDIVTRHGYEGGAILPGLAIMTHYLNEKTALLPKLDPTAPLPTSLIGKSTSDAMLIGTRLGFFGMIRFTLDRISAELQEREKQMPSVITTGGSVSLLAEPVPNSRDEPDLTLLGLFHAFKRTGGRFKSTAAPFKAGT